MSKASRILQDAKRQAGSVSTWADLSNAIFDPIDGLVAKAFLSVDERKKFIKTKEYREIQHLVQEAMDRFGVVAGAQPQKSGRFVVRLPRSLHASLEREAEIEGVSLNQLVVAKLACQLDSMNRSDSAVVRSFFEVRDRWSTDRVVVDPALNRPFLDRCRQLGATGTDFDLNWTLYNARKNGLMGHRPTKTRSFSVEEADEFEYASEIGITVVQRSHVHEGKPVSLDRIMCDPTLVASFDQVASDLAPGYGLLQYRWVALGWRKAGRLGKQAESVQLPELIRLGSMRSLKIADVPEEAGLYLFDSENDPVYIGETANLHDRIDRHLQSSDSLGLPLWLFERRPKLNLSIATLPTVRETVRRAMEWKAVRELRPKFNYLTRVA